MEEHVCQFRNGFDFPNFSNDADKPQSCWSRILTDMPQQQNHFKGKATTKTHQQQGCNMFFKREKAKNFFDN